MDFAHQYQFTHVTRSPHYPPRNGLAERTVQTAKRLLKNADDPFLALLSYRATPLPWCGKSPAELLMGRNIRTNLPQATKSLIPQWPYIQDFRDCNEQFKRQQKADYDRRHRVHELLPIPDNTDVWITTDGNPIPGTTVNPAEAPRSYIVRTPSGNMRRNRSQLNVNPSPTHAPDTSAPTSQDRSPIMTRSRTGTIINPPDRL